MGGRTGGSGACRWGGPWSFVLAGFVLVVLGTPAPAFAQDLGIECEPVSWRVLQSNTFGTARITWIGGPVLLCPDGTQIRADSAVVYDADARSELIGNVRIDHPERQLRAARADYYERDERLFALGAVEFLDRIRGNELRGDTLTFLEAGLLRPEQEVHVSGRQAFALLRAGEESDASPYEVTANRIRILGERFFWASEGAQVVRDSLHATADSLVFDEASGNLTLNGGARVLRGKTEMDGNRITLVLPDDVLNSVELSGAGRIRTEEMEARGDEVRLVVVEDRVQRLLALRRPDPSGATLGGRATLLVEGLFVEADSIDIVAPDEVPETMTAVGRARVETRSAGEGAVVAIPVPDAASGPDAPPAEDGADAAPGDLPVEDFMEGQQIVAHFRDPSAGAFVPDAAGVDPSVLVDTTVVTPDRPEVEEEGPQVRLERLVATGGARSWYRTPPEDVDDPSSSDRSRWSISYLLADEIVVYMLESGEVDWIEATGNIRGWQSEPDRIRTATTDEPGTEDGA